MIGKREVLEMRIASALAIHAPCHDDKTAPWACERGHYDAAHLTGIPDQPPECVACGVRYPCPTAAVLDPKA